MDNKLWTPDKSIHLPTPELIGFFLEVGAWDKAGKLYHQERIRSRSPVQAFLKILLVHMTEGVSQSTLDTGGVARLVDDSQNSYWAKAPLNNSIYGIVLGTDATAVDITDHQLAAQIHNGVGAGQMVHNAMVIDGTITIADPDAYFEFYRNFNNNSGGSISVRETGLYCKANITAVSYYFCIVRDVPTLITVPDGGGCYVKYTAKITE